MLYDSWALEQDYWKGPASAAASRLMPWLMGPSRASVLSGSGFARGGSAGMMNGIVITFRRKEYVPEMSKEEMEFSAR
jgi:hypothetical protein